MLKSAAMGAPRWRLNTVLRASAPPMLRRAAVAPCPPMVARRPGCCRAAATASTATRQLRGGVQEILEVQLGLSHRQISQALQRCPSIATQDAATVREQLELLRSEAGIDEGRLSSVVRHAPCVLVGAPCELLDGPPPDVAGVCTVLRAQAAGAALSDAVLSCPTLLLQRPDALMSVLGWLAGLRVDLVRIIEKAPQVLVAAAEQREAVVKFLCTKVGLSNEQLSAILGDYPMLLTYQPETQLAPLVEFLLSRGVDPADDRCRGLFAWPNSERRLAPALDFLTSGELAPFYSETLLLQEPLLLCYSFDLRIKPRGQFFAMRAKHLKDEPEACEPPPLWALSSADDEEFCNAIGAPPSEYAEFRRTTQQR
jgi:hypothetical protein